MTIKKEEMMTIENFKITMMQDTLYSVAWTAQVLKTHPILEGSRGTVGSLNHCWQVWQLIGNQLRVAIYKVDFDSTLLDSEIRNEEICKALARACFPNGGTLRRKKDYWASFAVI